MVDFHKKYIKYKNKYNILKQTLNQTHTGGTYIDGPHNIYSIGFELQTSDLLFLKIMYDPTSGNFVTDFMSPDDGDRPIDLFSYANTFYKVKLDDMPSEQLTQADLQWRSLLHFVVPYNDTHIESFEGTLPHDTEFITINTDIDSVNYYEMPVDDVDYSELIKTHYLQIQANIFNFHIRDNYQRIEFNPLLDERFVYILYIPRNMLSNSVTHFGFMQYGFHNPNNANELYTINIIPQVTFQCDLQYARKIIFHLISNTPNNNLTNIFYQVNMEIAKIFKKDYHYNTTFNVLSFVFFIKYYNNVMSKHHDKQFLGIALRHTFREIYNNLNESEKHQIGQIINISYELDKSDKYELSDGITRFQYNNDNKILIEFRLLGYMLSQDPNNNSIPITIK